MVGEFVSYEDVRIISAVKLKGEMLDIMANVLYNMNTNLIYW